MNLSELNDLDLSNIANWPLPARAALISIVFVAVLGLGYWFDIKDQGIRLEKAEQKEKVEQKAEILKHLKKADQV